VGNTLNAYLLLISFCPSKKAVTPKWHQIFLRGIGCNWLVCIAVWVRTLSLNCSIYPRLLTFLSFSISKLREHERPFQRYPIGWPHRVSFPHLSFSSEIVDLRYMDTYLGAFRSCLISLPLHAHSPSYRSSSRVDLITVTLSHSTC
jgi:hypothetical protein